MKNKPIRVAHIVGKWLGGGVESVVMNYYRHIDRNKIQFDFICDSDSTDIPYDEIKALGGKVIVVPPYQHIFKYLTELKKIFKKNNYKIVHAHLNTLSIFPLYAAKKALVPIRIAHNHSTTSKKEWKKNLIKNLLKPFSKIYATDYFACTEYAGKWLFGKEDFYILNNAIDLEKFSFNNVIREKMRKELGVNKEAIVFGHVGRFVTSKNHKFIIKIFNSYHKKNNNSVLILVGQGPLMEEVKKEVKQLKLLSSVIFLGQRNDMDRLYQAFDLLLFPSLYEGLGMVLIEAQATGLPCITSNVVPTDAKVSNLIEFLPIADSDEQIWVNSIKNKKIKSRKSQTKIVSSYGYNIKNEAHKLEEYYINKVGV